MSPAKRFAGPPTGGLLRFCQYGLQCDLLARRKARHPLAVFPVQLSKASTWCEKRAALPVSTSHHTAPRLHAADSQKIT